MSGSLAHAPGVGGTQGGGRGQRDGVAHAGGAQLRRDAAVLGELGRRQDPRGSRNDRR